MPTIDELTTVMSERQTPKLNAQALSALDPKQQMAVAKHRQSQEQQAVDRAKAIAETQMQNRSQNLQEQQLELDRISQAIDTKIQQQKLAIQRENAEALNNLREAKTDKAIMEKRRLERKQEIIESSTETTVNTNMGEMSPAKMMVFNNAGLDVKPAEPQVVDTFTNEDGSMKALTVTPGKSGLQVEDLEGLQGYRNMPDKKEVLGPGAKTKAREGAKRGIEAARDSEWRQNRIEYFKEANPEYDRILNFSNDQAEIQEAEQALIESLKTNMEVQTDDSISVRKGPKGVGFYGENSGYIGPLPSTVSEENVLDTGSSKPSVEDYSDPKEVQQDYKDGKLSKNQSKRILKEKWPDRFKFSNE